MRDVVRFFRKQVAGIVCLVMLVAVGPAAAQQNLSGTYLGLDAAQGLSVQLQDNGRSVSGRVSAPDGSGQSISGEMKDGSAVAKLIFRGQQGIARFTPKGVGLSMIWSPADQNGNRTGGADVVFAFRRQSLDLPAQPAGFVPAPPPGTRRFEPGSFLRSYEFWEPNAVAEIYDVIGEQYRAIIRLFPAVQTDLIWKLCQSTSVPSELGEALRGEGVTCAQVDSTIKASQATGGFNRFKRRVHTEKADALLAVECARGIHNAPVCIDAARRTQRAASALETVATVIKGI